MQNDHRDHIGFGVFYAVTAMALLTVQSALTKILSENHHVIEIAFYRNFLFAVALVLYILVRRKPSYFRVKKPALLLFRAVLGTFSLIVTYQALSLLPLSDATMLFFVSVLFTPALAFFLLKEYVGPHRWGAIILGLAGVALIVGPSGQIPLWGGLLAVFAGFMHAVVQVILRTLRGESSLSVTLYFTLGAAVICGAFMPFIARAPSSIEMVYLIALAAAGGFGQIALSSSYRLAPASLISPFNFSGLLWATLFDIVIWSDIPGWPVFTGAGILLAAQLYILYRERRNQKTVTKGRSSEDSEKTGSPPSAYAPLGLRRDKSRG